MLSLDKPLTVDGVTVWRDSNDTSLFWVLPPDVGIARNQDGSPAFSFLVYKPAVAGSGIKGGGYLMLESILALSDRLRGRIMSRINSEPGSVPPVKLAVPPFDNGTVQCIALHLQGSAGTAAQPAPPGTFNAVELIQGATVPAMDQQNTAAFSLTLSQEGAIILKQAFEDGMAPIGVVYSLSYLALRPALNVEITADFEQIYNHFSASLEGQYSYFKAGIEAAFESLVKTGAITIKVLNFTGEQDEKDQEKWALEFFKNDLLAKWFEPTLAPNPAVAGAVTGGGGTTPTPTPGGTTPGGTTPTPTPGGTTPTSGGGGAAPAPGGTTPAPTGGGTTPAPERGGGATSGGAASGGGAPVSDASAGGAAPAVTERVGGGGPTTPATQLQPATLSMTSQQPETLPASYSVTHRPSTPPAPAETVKVTGAGATITVADQPVTAGANGQITVTVNPGEQKRIHVNWPASGTGGGGTPPPAAETEQVFGLFFDFDEPSASGWRVQPPSDEFRAYVQNTTADLRFQDASGTLRLEGDGDWTGPQRGADRLTAWLNALPANSAVRLDAYASHEHGDNRPESERAAYNMALSRRRLDVARAIVQRQGTPPTAVVPHGDSPADTRPGGHGPMSGDPDNRVVHITATIPATTAPVSIPATPAAEWIGVLARPASTPGTTTPGTTTSGTTTPGTTTPGTTTPGTTAPGTTTPGTTTPGTTTPGTTTPGTTTPGATKPEIPTAAALKLKFVRKEERKKLTIRFNRAEAVSRVFAPQGFLGLLLQDLDNPSRLFKEIDLDSPFFREFTVEARTPIDFAQIGLTSAQVSIDYGNSAAPEDHKHGELSFTATESTPKTFRTFLNSTRDIDYDAVVKFEFDPQSAWDGDKFTYRIQMTDATERVLTLNPFQHIDFRQLRFEPGDIDFEVVSSIEINLQAHGYSTPEPSKQLRLTQDSGPQTWQLRGALPAPADRHVIAALTQVLKDGTSRQTPPVVVDQSTVLVHDLFPDALDLRFVPALEPGQATTVFVDVEYDDEPNGYHRDFHHELPGDTTATLRIRLALPDPAKRTYRYRLTFKGPGSAFDQRPWIETSEELIPIR